MLKFTKKNQSEIFYIGGFVCLMLGVGFLFFTPPPFGQPAGPLGDGWIIAAPLFAAGLFLFGLDSYRNR
jgi:hypothetical protein